MTTLAWSMVVIFGVYGAVWTFRGRPQEENDAEGKP